MSPVNLVKIRYDDVEANPNNYNSFFHTTEPEVIHLNNSASISICLIGEVIAAHQHRMIQRSRQIQALLHFPTCMHIFSEADTEINEDDIKVSAVVLFLMILFTGAGALSALVGGTAAVLDNLWIFGLSVGVPSSLGLALWLWLALSCRRRSRNRRDVAWDTEDVSIQDPGMKGVLRDNDDEKATLFSEEGKSKAIDIIGPDKILGGTEGTSETRG